MRINVYFLGTSGWYTSKSGYTPCILIDTSKFSIILDAGNGISLLDKYIKNLNKPCYLFLSHFHLDHISGLHVLDKFNFEKGLTIFCYKGGNKILNKIVNQPFTIPFKDLNFKTKIIEVGQGTYKKTPFIFEARQVVHSSKCYGYRFDINHKIITYCTDTGMCKGALRLADDADLLITECALMPGQEKKEGWPHLNPQDAANLALKAEAKRLILMHFDAFLYRSLKDRKNAELSAKKIFKNVIAAKDGMKITL